MANSNYQMTLGAKAATHGEFTATLTVEVKVTRRAIWVYKLRAIWAIIRAEIKRG